MDFEFCQTLLLHLLRWLLSFVIMWCITLIDLQMLNHPCIPEMNPTRSWSVILLLFSWIWFPYILPRIFLHLWSSEIFACNFFIPFTLRPTPVSLSLSHPTTGQGCQCAIWANPVTDFQSSTYWTYFDPVDDSAFFLLSTSFSWICSAVLNLFLFLGCAPHLLSWYLLISPTLNLGAWGLRPWNILLACLSLLISRIMALHFLSVCDFQFLSPAWTSSPNPRFVYTNLLSFVYFINNSMLSANFGEIHRIENHVKRTHEDAVSNIQTVFIG